MSGILQSGLRIPRVAPVHHREGGIAIFTLRDGLRVRVLDNHAHVGYSHSVILNAGIPSGFFGADELIVRMDAAGIDMACCFPTANPHTDYSDPNEQIVQWSRKYPDRIIPYARVNPHFGADHNCQAIERFAAAGVRGLKLHPFLEGAFAINDRRLIHPLMEVAGAHKLLVLFHCGESWAATPGLLADLAMDFPKVNFVCGHMGLIGFHTEAVAFARRLENFYLDTAELYPSFWVAEAVRRCGKERVLWGSDIPYNPYGEELDKVVRWAGVPEDALPAVLGGNLARLLHLDG